MSKRVRWAEIEEELNELGKPSLLRLLKELYDASAGNQAFFATRFLDQGVTAEMREPYRKRIIHPFFPKRGFGKLDLRVARQASQNCICSFRIVSRDWYVQRAALGGDTTMQ